jgi:hypothetical protein
MLIINNCQGESLLRQEALITKSRDFSDFHHSPQVMARRECQPTAATAPSILPRRQQAQDFSDFLR